MDSGFVLVGLRRSFHSIRYAQA